MPLPAFLFSMDPEVAHDFTLNQLAHTQNTFLDRAYRQPWVSDPIQLAGLTFPNRVGMAAGLDKNARCIDGLGAMGFGFVEVGTVTPWRNQAMTNPACSGCQKPKHSSTALVLTTKD